MKKKGISLQDYKDRYNKHVEEITRLQKLILIEEQKLFELIETKKKDSKTPFCIDLSQVVAGTGQLVRWVSLPDMLTKTISVEASSWHASRYLS